MEPMNSNSGPGSATAIVPGKESATHQESFLLDPALKVSHRIGLKEMNRGLPLPSILFFLRFTDSGRQNIGCGQ